MSRLGDRDPAARRRLGRHDRERAEAHSPPSRGCVPHRRLDGLAQDRTSASDPWARGFVLRRSPTWARNVRLLTVRDDGEEIVVDIYGGDHGVVGTILYRPDSPERHRDTIATLMFWKDRGTPLTYLCRDGVASLRDEEAAFRAAHGADAD